MVNNLSKWREELGNYQKSWHDGDELVVDFQISPAQVEILIVDLLDLAIREMEKTARDNAFRAPEEDALLQRGADLRKTLGIQEP